MSYQEALKLWERFKETKACREFVESEEGRVRALKRVVHGLNNCNQALVAEERNIQRGEVTVRDLNNTLDSVGRRLQHLLEEFGG